MRRLALFAIFQWLGITAFCQSPAITSGTAQTPGDKPPLFRPLFDFNRDQFDAQANTNQLFHVPCLNLDSFAEVAQTNVPASPFSGGQWPKAKGLPIPTQWPDAKVEQIPTTWPNLKMLRISANDQRPASEK